MTTTNMYQGIDDGSRSSSKVLKPPGGGSSNIFGDPEPRGQPAQRQQQATNVLGQPLDQPGANQGAPEPRDYSQQTQNPTQLPAAGFSAGTKAPEQVRAQSKKPQDSFNNIFGDNSPGQGGQQRNRRKGDSAFNPITGEDYEQSPQSTQQRNASRVLNPPGGKSSGLW